ncbi:MAG: hypothetical protein HW400_652 [Candidatus Levybacteria bacterium]|nr:hypothetical protein [Candidatus Levybacteria bacterium]
MKQLDLSIIIGNYNTEKLLEKTISSVYRNIKNISFEIIVVDDGSSDRSVEMVKNKFPKIKIRENAKNLGYSKTYNIGTRLSKSRYVLHLNSDIFFTKDSSLDLIIKFMDKNQNIGISGCKIIKRDGSLDMPCKRSLPTIINVFSQTIGLYKIFPKIKSLNYYLTYIPDDEIARIECIMGAFMLIRKELIKKIGYLDERFFIYSEDIDYCYRAIKAGWSVYYFPKIKIKHMHGGTTQQFKFKYLLNFHKGMFLYYNKHFARKNLFLVNYLIYSGILLRLAFFTVIGLLSEAKSKFS